jgi:hypothetical protein
MGGGEFPPLLNAPTAKNLLDAEHKNQPNCF